MRKIRLKELRKNAKITQNDLATAINVQRYTIANWENGRAEPDIQSLKLLADFFKVSIDYLLGNNNIVSNDIRIALDGNPDDLTDEQKIELQNFANYLISKNKK